MDRLQKDVILLQLVNGLQDKGSWCGGTDIQKATYFLQEMLGIPLGFDFILYKHGPYSFELNDELSAMRGDDFLSLQVRDERYGPCYRSGQLSSKLIEQFPRTSSCAKDKIEFVAGLLGSCNVAELERLATALYLRKSETMSGDSEDVAQRLVRIKPHIVMADAIDAVNRVDRAMVEASQLLAS